MISMESVSKRYNGDRTMAVDAVDLKIDSGEFVILLGESGCGKTTTLKMINRLIEPTAGRIEIDGLDAQTIEPSLLRRRIGYVFQQVGLFPHMTVQENIAITPELLGWPADEIDERVETLLTLVNLSPGQYRDRLPGELSGGQRQRVGLARALAARPKIMLMDEPFGALDPITRDTLQDEYRRIHEALGLTTVMVTHDMTEALLLAERIVVMRRGRIVSSGAPHELLAHPDDDYTRRLMETPKRQADRLEALASSESEAPRPAAN